jgi:fatty acid desaturase
VRKSGVEYVTLCLAFIFYGSFIALTLSYHSMPRWLFAILGSLLLTWYGSLQHETIHGHPTPSRRINTLIGALPLAWWIPYRLYRESHRRHHRHDGRYLTDVDRDPESFYGFVSASSNGGPVRRALARFNCTLSGRLLLGPALSVGQFWAREWRKICRGTGSRRTLWARHAVGMLLVCGWLAGVCHIPLAFYAAAVVYPSIAFGLLRSFAEHRADSDVRRRTRVVEAGPLWSLVFLNNNLHIAHHAHPDAPWYCLPRLWRHMRAGVTSPDLVVTGGYSELVGRFFARSVMSSLWDRSNA